jgi:AAA domain-containing protein
MRIPTFEARNQRGIRLARCEAVPPLMVIAGPNGSGKSTLLNAIRANAGYTNIMYVGPHRAIRKQVVQQRHLMTQPFSLETFLSSQTVSGIEGIRIFDGNRDPWGYDESANHLKHTLCQGHSISGRYLRRSSRRTCAIRAAAAHRLARSVSSGRTSSRRRASLAAEGAVSARGSCSCALWNRAPGRPASKSGRLRHDGLATDGAIAVEGR